MDEEGLTDAIFAHDGPLVLTERRLVGQLRLLAIIEGCVNDACDPCGLRHITGWEADGTQKSIQQCRLSCTR